MPETTPTYFVRHPSQPDLDRVYDFMVLCDMALYNEPDTDRDDLLDQWSKADPAQDAWIAVSKRGEIVGYGLVMAAGDGFQIDLYAHKKLTPRKVIEELLARCEARSRDLASGRGGKPALLTGYADHANEKLCLAFEKEGFPISNRHYRMQLDFHEPIDLPDWPEGFQVQAFRPEDERELYELITSAFDWPGRSYVSFEWWKEHMFRNGRIDPELFLLLKQGSRLVGAALAYDEQVRGWIRQLAVAKDLQGRGLGSRLLRHILGVFYQRGLPYAALGVSSLNEKAVLFYERCGMHRSREFIEYRKTLT